MLGLYFFKVVISVNDYFDFSVLNLLYNMSSTKLRVALNSLENFNLPVFIPILYIPCSILKYIFLTGRYLNSDIILVLFFFFLLKLKAQLKWLNQFIYIVVTQLICNRKILNLNYCFQDPSHEIKLMDIDLFYQNVCQTPCKAPQR